jgi:hypothetical protein
MIKRLIVLALLGAVLFPSEASACQMCFGHWEQGTYVPDYCGYATPGNSTCLVAGNQCYLGDPCGVKTKNDVSPDGTVLAVLSQFTDKTAATTSLGAWLAQSDGIWLKRDCRGDIVERRYEPGKGAALRVLTRRIEI